MTCKQCFLMCIFGIVLMTAKLGLFFSGSTGEKHWTVPHLKGPCHFVAQTKGYHGIQKHKFNLCIDKKKKKKSNCTLG